jgi:hypothetical protein
MSALQCSSKHDPSQPLVVVLKLDAGFENAGVLWSTAPGSSAALLVEGVNAKGIQKTTLTGDEMLCKLVWLVSALCVVQHV